jgi:lipopolysaccharide biosynthesis regulator YciM
VTKSLILTLAAMTLSSAAAAQPAPKPISRADYINLLNSRFNTVDSNHDGNVTRDELAAQQQRDLAQERATIQAKLRDAFKQLDTNKDGALSLAEFLASAPGIKTTQTPEQLLQGLDANHDGKVSADEFRAPQLAKFNRVDANHDGVVSPEEQRAASGK